VNLVPKITVCTPSFDKYYIGIKMNSPAWPWQISYTQREPIFL
jgi:hypothetical protein